MGTKMQDSHESDERESTLSQESSSKNEEQEELEMARLDTLKNDLLKLDSECTGIFERILDCDLRSKEHYEAILQLSPPDDPLGGADLPAMDEMEKLSAAFAHTCKQREEDWQLFLTNRKSHLEKFEQAVAVAVILDKYSSQSGFRQRLRNDCGPGQFEEKQLRLVMERTKEYCQISDQRTEEMMSEEESEQQEAGIKTGADELPFYLRSFTGETALQQLLHVVGQEGGVKEWREQLPPDTLTSVRKLGEGTYGEVYATTMNGAPVAMKVIPFEDEVPYFEGTVNGERLKSTAEILPEILITRELSALNNDSAAFSTSTFIPLVQCHVVQGNYPAELLDEWDAFHERKKSENDRPTEYACPDALFLAIGLAMGGVDVESYKVKSEREALSALFQLALALVVAENELEFEHRDLHIGNALIAHVPADEEIKYRLLGRDVFVKSHGVKLSIIDFTNSRLRKDGTTIFLDLEHDEELFQGQGDFQFDIYRLMRQHNKGDWRAFSPKSNIYWLHYMAKELIMEERKKGLAKGFPKRRRRELLEVFEALPEYDEIKSFLQEPAVHELMQDYVRFEES